MSIRDSAFRTFKRTRNNEDWESYKALRNKTKQMLRNSKFRYIRNLNSETINVKEIWQNFRKLGIGKRPTELNIQNYNLDELNSHFVSVAHN